MLAAKIGYFRATSHPEALAWRTAVIANGGSVSATTFTAVETFCRAIDAAGIRDRFYRLSLFAGSNLSAALVPLYRGQSLGGTQFGNATDTNTNFVAGDYIETGATGGLRGNGTSKRLDTGFATNSLPNASSRHISAYQRTKSTGTFDSSIGGGVGSPSFSYMVLRTANPATTMNFSTNGTEASDVTGNASGGHWIGQNATITASALYRNGSLVGAGGVGPNLLNSASTLGIFADNNGTSFGNFSNAVICGYSAGLHFTDAQAAALHTAFHTFNTTLGRNY